MVVVGTVFDNLLGNGIGIGVRMADGVGTEIDVGFVGVLVGFIFVGGGRASNTGWTHMVQGL